MSEHGSMTQKLVNNVGLGRVEWSGVMPDVLGRVENFECEAIQEFALRQKTTHWFKAPACARLEELRNVFKLWDSVSSKTDIFLEFRNSPIELLARIGLVKFGKCFVAELPGGNLLLRVLETGNLLANLVIKGEICDFFSACAVDRISEAGVVCILDTISLGECALADKIKVAHFKREPWDNCVSNFLKSTDDRLEFIHTGLNILVIVGPLEINVDVHGSEPVRSRLRWFAMDLREIHIVLIHERENFSQGALLIWEGDNNAGAVLGFPKLQVVVEPVVAGAHSHLSFLSGTKSSQ